MEILIGFIVGLAIGMIIATTYLYLKDFKPQQYVKPFVIPADIERQKLEGQEMALLKALKMNKEEITNEIFEVQRRLGVRK